MSDVRHEYRALTDVERGQVRAIKDAGQLLVDLCVEIGKSRELSLAITNTEMAVMWAVKHCTR